MTKSIFKILFVSLVIPFGFAQAKINSKLLEGIVSADIAIIEEVLANHPADIEGEGTLGSPLDYAVLRGRPLIVAFLIERGARVTDATVERARAAATRNPLAAEQERANRWQIIVVLEAHLERLRDAELVRMLREARRADRAAAETAAAAAAAVVETTPSTGSRLGNLRVSASRVIGAALRTSASKF